MSKFRAISSGFILFAWLALISYASATSAAPEASLFKGHYTQKKYHKIKDRVQEWHHCDFSIDTTLKGDFSGMDSNATLDLSISRAGFDELFVLAGELNRLGSVQPLKNGGKLVLAPGDHNFGGSIQWSDKQLVIKVKAKTSKESSDFSGGNYLLPIDEDIFNFVNGAPKLRPPFTGAAVEKIGLRLTGEQTPTFYSFSLVYKGVNSNPNDLPSQTLNGALLKE